ncbi:uncharacterized protein (DUF1778 family) [Hoeflea marina]|uniref:Uncharacterized protein (DUF1778 family) n=1 Tax=Hoeflea marina TaxID=274592 RepID=A0A317PNK5_9HYPH|nr:DUF1778 domain-containing protein [Hoeflea marina]PWW01809.1 uncharacterized protein (DUF1778 family) [Hoeflea marina]
MNAKPDAALSKDEPKTARMEQRTKPHIKAAIQHAAALLGMDETNFVTSAAYERAKGTILSHERTVLSPADSATFLAALQAPADPTDDLRAAMADHARLVAKGE